MPTGRRRDDAPAAESSHLHVFNPGPGLAQARVTVYRVTGMPSTFTIAVAPGTLATVDLMSRREIPRHEAFWIALESDQDLSPALTM